MGLTPLNSPPFSTPSSPLRLLPRELDVPPSPSNSPAPPAHALPRLDSEPTWPSATWKWGHLHRVQVRLPLRSSLALWKLTPWRRHSFVDSGDHFDGNEVVDGELEGEMIKGA